MRRVASPLVLVSVLATVTCGGSPPPEPRPEPVAPPAVVGRWDATVEDHAGPYPAWFEIEAAGGDLSGRFVGRAGSARPITEIRFDGETLRFSLPPQYEKQKDDLLFVGRIETDTITGETYNEEGQNVAFAAGRAPLMAGAVAPAWGEPIDLLRNGRQGWRLRSEDGPDGWTMDADELVNTPPSVDLLTEQSFGDFKLSLEFLMPEGSNSGVYLRGRHELQIQDDHGKEPDSRRCGGIYGFVTPTAMACRAAGHWNEVELTLVGRRVTVVLNGDTIMDKVEIPGITGGALDSDEGEPGPLMLQGDHRAVRFRNVILTPARTEEGQSGGDE